MDTREYIQKRIGTYTKAIATAQRSKDGNTFHKDRWDERIQQFEYARAELRRILYFIDMGEEHPDLHSEWTNETHEKKFVKKVPRTRSGPQTRKVT